MKTNLENTIEGKQASRVAVMKWENARTASIYWRGDFYLSEKLVPFIGELVLVTEHSVNYIECWTQNGFNSICLIKT
jgi:hypothetical protein